MCNPNQLNWVRYWLPWGGEYFSDFDGFFSDPESDMWKYLPNPPKRLEQLEGDYACLILLGDPGMGKTTEWKQAVHRRQNEKLRVISIDLETLRDQSLFHKQVFDRLDGEPGDTEAPWHLYLDGVDAGVPHFFPYFMDQLAKYSSKAIRCRVACRSAFWQDVWTSRLQQFYGDQPVHTVELAPLRRKDVQLALADSGCNPEVFIEGIQRRNLIPLASRPITLLQLLVPLYKSTTDFPNSLADLYERGCLLLCSNERGVLTRADHNRPDPLVLLDTAKRVAAVAVVTGHPTIRLDLGLASEELGALTPLDVGGEWTDNSGSIRTISLAMMAHTCDTGLYTKIGARIGWAHSTFAEYLAARFLQNLPLAQILGILDHHDGRLVPQLHGLAAWLCNFRQDVLEHVLLVDPKVLLLADLPSHETSVRSRLVEAVLEDYKNGELRPYVRDTERHFAKLNHPEIADQIRAYVIDHSHVESARIEAIRIAHRCRLTELGGFFVDLALNRTEDLEVRVVAAHAAVDCADVADRKRLLPLAPAKMEDDPSDDIKGYALEALWPDCITVKELFALLTPEKESHYFGSYSAFITYELVRRLKAEDFLVALEWVANNPIHDHYQVSHFASLADDIMVVAWDNLATQELIDAFARATVARQAHHQGAVSDRGAEQFRERLRSDTKRRRAVLQAMIPYSTKYEGAKETLLVSRFVNQEPWIAEDDFDWLVGLFNTVSDNEGRMLVAEMIKACLNWDNTNQLSYIISESQTNTELKQEFQQFLDPVPLDSPVADAGRERLRKGKEREDHFREMEARREKSKYPPLTQLLDKAENENIGYWYHIWRSLDTEHPGSISPHYKITALKGWLDADATTRDRIVGAAHRFVLEVDPKSDEWLGTNSWPIMVVAGRAALTLLQHARSQAVREFSCDTWTRWVPVIVSLSPRGIDGMDDIEAFNKLLEQALRTDADLVTSTVIRIINANIARSEAIIDKEIIRKCWCESLQSELRKLAWTPRTSIRTTGQLLEVLLCGNDEPTFIRIVELLTLPFPVRRKERYLRVEAALAVLTCRSKIDWKQISTAMNGDRLFGRLLALRMADQFSHAGDFVNDLSPNQLADLYLWLVREFPYESDPKEREDGRVTSRLNVAQLRRLLLGRLTGMATDRAVDELRRIELALPHYQWLHYYTVEAADKTRASTWRPIAPQLFRRLIAESQSRFVQSPRQLLNVIVEALDRVQKDLQDRDLPSIREVWDCWKLDGNLKFRPIDEEDLSDFIARRLRDLIAEHRVVVNREVQVRRRFGSVKGQRTDIKVDALPAENIVERSPLTVIIEVKGCWNDSLRSAMKTQLRDEYLEMNSKEAGIYLVGSFACADWDPEDYRKNNCARNGSYSTLETYLRQQAEALSTPPFVVVSKMMDCRILSANCRVRGSH